MLKRQNNEVKIRTAIIEDAPDLLDIYSYYVENTAVTYEYEIPSLTEFQNRILKILEHFPYLVAEVDGERVGYAYAGRYHERAAYGWNVETTIYLKKDCCRQGVGRQLYTLLEKILKEQGIVKTIAIIVMPKDEYTNHNSMQFHEKMGFKLAGKMDDSGYKFNRWYTTIWMDKLIGTPAEKMCGIKRFDDVREKFGL